MYSVLSFGCGFAALCSSVVTSRYAALYLRDQGGIALATFRDYFSPVDTLTIKLPPQTHRRLAARARKLNQKKSTLVRDLIERALDSTGQTCHDLMQAGCGHYAGPSESSSKEGFDD